MALHPNPRGPRDETVRLFVAAREADGAGPMGILWNYGCHPVTAYPADVVSADYPGVVRRALRSGCGADLPVCSCPDSWATSDRTTLIVFLYRRITCCTGW